MNLNGRTINPGELRTAVLLAPPALETNAGGFQRRKPDTRSAVAAWAKWTGAHGAEVWTAASSTARATDTATVLIRYLAALDATWYVSADGGASWFEVVGAPDDIQLRHEYIEMQVKRTGAG